MLFVAALIFHVAPGNVFCVGRVFVGLVDSLTRHFFEKTRSVLLSFLYIFPCYIFGIGLNLFFPFHMSLDIFAIGISPQRIFYMKLERIWTRREGLNSAATRGVIMRWIRLILPDPFDEIVLSVVRTNLMVKLCVDTTSAASSAFLCPC